MISDGIPKIRVPDQSESYPTSCLMITWVSSQTLFIQFHSIFIQNLTSGRFSVGRLLQRHPFFGCKMNCFFALGMFLFFFLVAFSLLGWSVVATLLVGWRPLGELSRRCGGRVGPEGSMASQYQPGRPCPPV